MVPALHVLQTANENTYIFRIAFVGDALAAEWVMNVRIMLAECSACTRTPFDSKHTQIYSIEIFTFEFSVWECLFYLLLRVLHSTSTTAQVRRLQCTYEWMTVINIMWYAWNIVFFIHAHTLSDSTNVGTSCWVVELRLCKREKARKSERARALLFHSTQIFWKWQRRLLLLMLPLPRWCSPVASSERLCASARAGWLLLGINFHISI